MDRLSNGSYREFTVTVTGKIRLELLYALARLNKNNKIWLSLNLEKELGYSYKSYLMKAAGHKY